MTRSGTGASGGGSRTVSTGATSFSSSTRSDTQYNASGTVAWELDVWGRIRRGIESSSAAAQVSAADLANAQLSAQAALATDYFDLRAEDALADLLAQTVAADRRALQITENQYRAGTSSSIDYVTALAQMQSTQAQLVAVGDQRQQFEHAIAVLTGHAPAELTIAPAPLAAAVPVLRPACPPHCWNAGPTSPPLSGTCSRKRPDRRQIAAYYPDISLVRPRRIRRFSPGAIVQRQQPVLVHRRDGHPNPCSRVACAPPTSPRPRHLRRLGRLLPPDRV